jgi:FMN phosphatase YigB (HAD superfamily)
MDGFVQVLFIDDKPENIATAAEVGMLGFCFNAHTQSTDVLRQALVDLHLLPKA